MAKKKDKKKDEQPITDGKGAKITTAMVLIGLLLAMWFVFKGAKSR